MLDWHKQGMGGENGLASLLRVAFSALFARRFWRGFEAFISRDLGGIAQSHSTIRTTSIGQCGGTKNLLTHLFLR